MIENIVKYNVEIEEVYNGYGEIDGFTVKPDFFSVSINGRHFGFSSGRIKGNRLEVFTRRSFRDKYYLTEVEVSNDIVTFVKKLKQRKKYIYTCQDAIISTEPMCSDKWFTYNGFNYISTDTNGVYMVEDYYNNFIRYEVVTLEDRRNMERR